MEKILILEKAIEKIFTVRTQQFFRKCKTLNNHYNNL